MSAGDDGPGDDNRPGNVDGGHGGQLVGACDRADRGVDGLAVPGRKVRDAGAGQQTRRRDRNEDGDPLLWSLSRLTTTAAATVPATLSGLSLAIHWGGGLYWLALAALLGIVGAVYGAWVLLVEIVR
jgi:hypothetical protein